MTSVEFTPSPEPVVLKESAEWLAVSKPAGWLTIPGRGDSTYVLSEWAKRNFGAIWIVHRLDRETSGMVLFAKSAEAHEKANRWFRERKVKKTYECIATGLLRAPVVKINVPIDGAPSVTQVEVLEAYQEGFLAKVRPLTGRTHQIRIHLSHEGHPLWGDSKYGGPEAVTIGGQSLRIQRTALHSAELELPEGESFRAPWPADFNDWVECLRNGGKRV
jgi:23S rRNA pseudouridine1911/1915/1917 synthase